MKKTKTIKITPKEFEAVAFAVDLFPEESQYKKPIERLLKKCADPKQKHSRTKGEFKEDYITDTKDFAGVIVDGGDGVSKKLKINSSTWYQTQLNKFRIGEKVTMYISSRRPKRSLQQNSYYWGVYLPLIAKETGEHSIERLHQLFSGKFLTKEIVEVLGEKVRIKSSTTELSKATFTEYIMDIEAFTGISAPPTDNYYD